MADSQIIIYQTEDGNTKIETRLEDETVWLTIDQMSELFSRNSTIGNRSRQPKIYFGFAVEHYYCKHKDG